MEELLSKDQVEGPEAFERFDALVSKVMSVPIDKIRQRDKEHKDTVHLRGMRRGPKPESDASRDSSDSAPA